MLRIGESRTYGDKFRDNFINDLQSTKEGGVHDDKLAYERILEILFIRML